MLQYQNLPTLKSVQNLLYINLRFFLSIYNNSMWFMIKNAGNHTVKLGIYTYFNHKRLSSKKFFTQFEF